MFNYTNNTDISAAYIEHWDKQPGFNPGWELNLFPCPSLTMAKITNIEIDPSYTYKTTWPTMLSVQD